jgi:hypothetical protein
MSKDFGYFGKGIDGYVHYMQAFDESNKGGGGGKKPTSGSGCLTALIQVVAGLVIIGAVIASLF